MTCKPNYKSLFNRVLKLYMGYYGVLNTNIRIRCKEIFLSARERGGEREDREEKGRAGAYAGGGGGGGALSPLPPNLHRQA